jgi:hypothetical protein
MAHLGSTLPIVPADRQSHQIFERKLAQKKTENPRTISFPSHIYESKKSGISDGFQFANLPKFKSSADFADEYPPERQLRKPGVGECGNMGCGIR